MSHNGDPQLETILYGPLTVKVSRPSFDCAKHLFVVQLANLHLSIFKCSIF